MLQPCKVIGCLSSHFYCASNLLVVLINMVDSCSNWKKPWSAVATKDYNFFNFSPPKSKCDRLTMTKKVGICQMIHHIEKMQLEVVHKPYYSYSLELHRKWHKRLTYYPPSVSNCFSFHTTKGRGMWKEWGCVVLLLKRGKVSISCLVVRPGQIKGVSSHYIHDAYVLQLHIECATTISHHTPLFILLYYCSPCKSGRKQSSHFEICWLNFLTFSLECNSRALELDWAKSKRLPALLPTSYIIITLIIVVWILNASLNWVRSVVCSGLRITF